MSKDSNIVSNVRFADLIEALVGYCIEEQRCLAKFQQTEGDEKHQWWQAAKECRQEIPKVREEINRLFNTVYHSGAGQE